MNWIINNLHRGIFCVLWLAPFVGAAENHSMWPLLLLPLPMICSVLPRLQDLACRSDQPTLALWSLFIALAVLCAVLIDFGLRPVGGLLGPGGWYLPLTVAAIVLTLLRSRIQPH